MWELPADPSTIIAFLTDCPAAPATLRRRVTAIDHHHAANGHPPGRTAPVLTALGRPTGEPTQLTVETAAAVEAALRGVPSHGWTQGMFVLSQLAGVPYKHLAKLTASDATIVDGSATITSSAGEWTVLPDDDPVVCGGCAVTRWLRVIDLAVTRVNTKVVASAVDKAE